MKISVMIILLVVGGIWYTSQKIEEHDRSMRAGRSVATEACGADVECASQYGGAFDRCFERSYHKELMPGQDWVDLNSYNQCAEGGLLSGRAVFLKSQAPFPVR